MTTPAAIEPAGASEVTANAINRQPRHRLYHYHPPGQGRASDLSALRQDVPAIRDRAHLAPRQPTGLRGGAERPATGTVTWTKLDDAFIDRDPIWRLSDAAFRMHVSVLTFSNRLLLDGQIPVGRLAGLVPHFDSGIVDELIAAGVWIREGETITIVDSLGDQPTAEAVRARQAQTKARVERWRAKLSARRNGVTNGVSNAHPDPTRPPSKEGRVGGRPRALRGASAGPDKSIERCPDCGNPFASDPEDDCTYLHTNKYLAALGRDEDIPRELMRPSPWEVSENRCAKCDKPFQSPNAERVTVEPHPGVFRVVHATCTTGWVPIAPYENAANQ